MVKAKDAITTVRALLGTPYSEIDCINLIKRVIRTAPGGVAGYTTAGTNTLWNSYEASAKYRDLTWRQESTDGARAGMLAFKASGSDVHHVGIVTGEGTVIHSSSAYGKVVETALDGSWDLLGEHRYIEPVQEAESEAGEMLYRARVKTQGGALNVRTAAVVGKVIAQIPNGETVEVCSAGDWQRVKWGETLGYVSAAYLEQIEETAEETAAETAVETDAQSERTTLIRADGVTVTLLGAWKIAED